MVLIEQGTAAAMSSIFVASLGEEMVGLLENAGELLARARLLGLCELAALRTASGHARTLRDDRIPSPFGRHRRPASKLS
jgi:hypothetical protein